MAEDRKQKNSSIEENVKLFVGQVPKSMSEVELHEMFSEFALVDRVNIIKDKTTKASKGCCFITCPSKCEADKAVDACHDKITLPGASNPLQVKYAEGEQDRLDHKLFVGMLAKNVSEAEMSELFSTFGTITDLHILRGSQHTSRGCAFLKFERKEEARAALEAINGKHKMEGSNVPLVVKWADTEKERQARRIRRAQSQACILPNVDSRQPSFGSWPTSFAPAHNGYGYWASGPFRIMQYQHLPPMQNHAAHVAMISHLNQQNTPPAAVSADVSPSACSAYSSLLPCLQHAVPPPAEQLTNHPAFSSPYENCSMGSSSDFGTSSCVRTRGGQLEGPLGANLFIYHLPQELGDQELFQAFKPFGNVLSAKVYIDKTTGLSKCFGFVSYDSPEAAETAISKMNDGQLNGKKLKVQLKRDNRSNSDQCS